MDYLDYERLARLKLKEFVNIKYGLLRLHDKNEKPDLIGNSLVDIGVEVTRAISKDEGRYYNVINYCMANKLGKEQCLSYAEKRKVEIIIEYDEKLKYTHYKRKGLINTKVIIDVIVKAIITKIKKFKNYLKFNSNELYIYVDFSLYIDDFIDLIKKEEIVIGNPFQYIYFDNNFEIFKWDIKNKTLKYIATDKKEVSRFIEMTKTDNY